MWPHDKQDMQRDNKLGFRNAVYGFRSSGQVLGIGFMEGLAYISCNTHKKVKVLTIYQNQRHDKTHPLESDVTVN